MKIAKDDPILIIGGGLAGITTAVALQFYEFTNVHIFEREPLLPVPAYPVQLGANALVALEDVGLAEIVRGSGLPWKALNIKWKSGKLLKSIPVDSIIQATNFAPMNMAFTDLHRILKRELPDSMFHLGEDLLSFTLGEDSVEAHFSNGDTHEGALLIGADGLNSRVRLQMMGRTEVRQDGRVAYHAMLERGFLPEPDHELLTQPQTEYWGPDKLCVLAAQGELQASISLYLPKPALEPKSISEWLSAEFEGWEVNIPEIIQHVTDDAWVKKEVADIPPLRDWQDWRVCITGDAAHPAYPYLGQSVSMTIESAIALARAIHNNPKKLDRGLKNYQKVRIKRSRKAVKAAHRRAGSLAVTNPVACALRNAIMPAFPNFLGTNTWLKLNKERYF